MDRELSQPETIEFFEQGIDGSLNFRSLADYVCAANKKFHDPTIHQKLLARARKKAEQLTEKNSDDVKVLLNEAIDKLENEKYSD